jgi:hypothetical protein
MANGDFIHMFTEGVEEVMRGLDGAGADLADGWRASLGEIDGGEGGIGGDPLGQAFRGVYDEPNTALRTHADRLHGALRTAAATGMSCSADYAATDERAAAAMPVVS